MSEDRNKESGKNDFDCSENEKKNNVRGIKLNEVIIPDINYIKTFKFLDELFFISNLIVYLIVLVFYNQNENTIICTTLSIISFLLIVINQDFLYRPINICELKKYEPKFARILIFYVLTIVLISAVLSFGTILSYIVILFIGYAVSRFLDFFTLNTKGGLLFFIVSIFVIIFFIIIDIEKYAFIIALLSISVSLIDYKAFIDIVGIDESKFNKTSFNKDKLSISLILFLIYPALLIAENLKIKTGSKIDIIITSLSYNFSIFIAILIVFVFSFDKIKMEVLNYIKERYERSESKLERSNQTLDEQ